MPGSPLHLATRSTTGTLLLALAAAVVIHFAMPSPLFATDAFEKRYVEALGLYERGQVNSAVQSFRTLINSNPDHDLADNAQYWIGEAYFTLRQYEQAIVEFDRTLTWRNTNKREDSLYKLAVCYERLNKPIAARELYLRLLTEFPKTRHASYVLEKIDQLSTTQP